MSNEARPPAQAAAQSDATRDITTRGNLIVVSAPSGAGKSSLVEGALKSVERLKYSISYTTRKARGAERDGVEYCFIGKEEFLDMRDRGEFLESAEVHGCLYGTERVAIERIINEGSDVILDIDVQGAMQVVRQMPEAVTIFVLPPSREILESRLRMRNLNAPEDLERRLKNASREVLSYASFEYVIVNDDLERATRELVAIIIAERQLIGRQQQIVKPIIDSFGGDDSYA
jgi:guanylate kinase